MGQRGPLRLGLALALVLVVSQQTFADQQCRTGCKGTSQVFKYASGTTYKYNYEGKIDISISSAEGQVSSTDVKAVVLLTQLADCNQLLRLQNVQITSGNGKKQPQIPGVDKPIRINFNDGIIEDSICADANDNQNSLNIKRAIASLFQVNYKTGYETDIFGVCPTEIAQHQEGVNVIIQKSRDLNKCAYRENLRHDFFATTFNLKSEIKSSPVLNGDYNAKLTVKNGILAQANVVESYLYIPFSVGKNGAKAEVTTKLNFVSASKESAKADVSVPKSIIFDNPHPVEAATSNVNTILNAVKEVAKSIDVIVGEKTAKEFVTLIKTVRAAKKDDLLAVYNQVRTGVGFSDKEVAKKIFLDALLQAGVGDTVEVAITLLKSHELSEIEQKMVYIGMSLVRHATLGSIKTATQLLTLPDLAQEAYLGIGNLVGRYCKQHSCENVDAVNQISTKLVAKLANPKTTDKKVENEIILVLKTLANFGHLNDNILQKIIAVAQNKQASQRLRAMALETYLSDACKDKIRNSALSLLQDIQQDSEIRIKAYLVLAKCPNAKIGNAVKALLEKEPSYQVGGFITSHIRNIKASANPDKQLAKQFLGFSLSKKYPVDFRKWSYNGELSYAVDTLGIAASSEANIIYSQESPLPISTNLNVTAEVFGHTFNFLEINTRQENLDKLVEHYFGPKGVLSTSHLGKLWKNKDSDAAKLWKNLNQKLEASLRTRRDVSKAEIDNIGKAVQIKENVLNKDLDLDISLKAFGSELLYKNLNIYQDKLSPDTIVDNIVKRFNEGLDKLKNFQEILRTNLLFLDVELDYPTSLGFPLRLAVEGTSNTQVKAEGGVDVRALINNKDTNINLKLIPSANIEISGRLTLDALVIESGLKIVSTLYTATGGDVKISLYNGGKGLDVKVGLPVQVQKLLSANHEIVFESREQAGPATVTPLKFAQAKDFSICLDQLSQFIGLEFCAEINGPNLAGKQVPVLPFPLAGDSKVSVTIGNEDVKEYHLKLENKDYLAGDLIVETIGKNGEKKLSIEIQSEISPQRFVKAIFTSPIKTAFVEGRITNSNQEKSLLLKAGQDKDEAYIKFGVAISGSQSKQVYSPILELKTPDGLQQLPLRVDGHITVEKSGKNEKYTFDNLKIYLPNEKVIGINGNLGNDGKDIFTDLAITDGQQTGSLTGRLHIYPNELKVNAEVKNTFNPMFNFKLQGDAIKSADNSQFDTNWQLIHGNDLSSKTNIITFSNSITKKYKSPSDFTVGFKNKFAYPLVGANINFEYGQTQKQLKYDLNFQYNEIKFGSDLDLEVNKKTNGDFDLELKIYGLENKVEFKSSRELEGQDKSKINNELNVNGMKLEIKGEVKHNIKPSNVDVGADLTVVIPTHPTPFKIESGLQYNSIEFDLNHKVTSGNVVVIDVFLKTNKNGNANGSAKVNIKNVLTVNGQIKAVKGVGNGFLQIEVVSLKKQVRFESTFEIQPPTTYHIVLTLYPAYATDKNQKLILSTNTKFAESKLDSKNSLNLLGKVLEVNLLGSRSWTAESGKHNGEIEVILPTNQYLLGKINGNYNRNGEVYSGNCQSSLEYRTNKNNAGRKVSISADYKNVNTNLGLYDVAYTIAADDANGKNINTDLTFKVQKQGENRVIDTSSKIYGSVLKQAILSAVHFSYSKGVGEYQLSSSYGTDIDGKIGGKYDIRGGSAPVLGELEVHFVLPNPNLKSLKSKLAGSVLVPSEHSDQFQLQGSASLYADSTTSSEPLVDFTSEGQVKASDKDGEIKGNLNSKKLGPVSLVAGYSRKEAGEKKEYNGNAALQYGNGKNFKIDGSLSKPNKKEYKLEVDIDTPFENYKKNNFVVTTKHLDEGNHVKSKITGSSDGSKWSLDTEIKASDISPLFDLKYSCSKFKKVEIHLDGNRVSDREFAVNYKVWCEHADFLLEGNLDADLSDLENFSVKGKINSPKLELDKITFEANNKPTKAAKRIHISVKSGQNNLVSGSTSYTAREEKGKYIIEGSGTLKVKSENKAANFKYICQQLTNEKNGEQGFEVSFDAGVGNKAIDAELKVTNKQFRISDSYCEKNKECAHFEYDSKLSQNEVDKFNHVLEITMDLRKLGIPNEFGLKSVTTRNNWVIDHTVDMHFQSPENSKYQYSVYLHPQEAGVSLTTPKRIVSLEGHYTAPKEIGKNGGKVSGEVAFYLDKKNQPNQKAALTLLLSSNPQNKNALFNGEVKLVHPGLSRPLSMTVESSRSGEMPNQQSIITSTIDIFAQPTQKIVSHYKVVPNIDTKNNKYSIDTHVSIKSTGLGIDVQGSEEISIDRKVYSLEYLTKVKYNVGKSKYENSFSVKGSKTGSALLVRLFNVDLLKVNNKYNIGQDQQVIDSEISSYDNKPIVGRLEVKKFNTLQYSVGYKDTPKEKLQLNTGLIPDQLADFRVDHISAGGKSNLFFATIKLDDANFLKPDYNINSEQIEKVLGLIKTKITSFISGLKNIGKELNNDIRKEATQFSELSKKASPNLEPLKQYYVNELQKLKSEIVQDKSLQEIGELLKTIIFAVSDVTSFFVVKVAEVVEAVASAVHTVIIAAVDSIEKHIIPAVKEVSDQISVVLAEIVGSLLDIGSSVLASIIEIVEKYQPELKQLAATFGELSKDVARFIQKSYEEARRIFINLYQKICDELKSLPIFEEFKAQWEDLVKNGLPNAEGIIGGIKEIAATIKDLIPPELLIQPEIVELIDLTVNYLEKKVKHESVDELAVFDKWTTCVINIAKKILNLITYDSSNISQPQMTFSLDIFRKLPKLVAVRFSAFDYLLNEDHSRDIAAFALSLLNNPRKWLPPFPLYGAVVQGQHIFTFDDRYFNFPANCKYLLARDAVDGNFTIIGTYTNGKLTAISFADKQDHITINEDGKVTLNNAHVELPTRKPELQAYREYDMVTIKSSAGVRIWCTPTLNGCGIYVSGFYHAKLKGLLGKGNNEPFDDFTIPNGKIVTSESDFGNAFKIGNCQPVKVPAEAAKNPVCEKLFGWESSMRLCYPFVDTGIYKRACAQGLAAKIVDAEAAASAAYVAACLNHNIPIAVPSNLVKCSNGKEIRTVGDRFSVKVPSDAADIILLVDTIKSNEPVYNELIKPAILDIVKGLAAKGINDVEFHLITYGGENQWPSHVTVGGKTTFKAKAPEVKFSEAPKDEDFIAQYMKPLDSFINDIQLALGQDLQARTYTEGYDYPFRAHAAKSIIAATSKPCEVGKLYPIQKLRTLLFKDNQISLNLITPFEDLKVKDAKKVKDIFGFNDEIIFIGSQGKKKSEGSAELHKELEYSDYCVDFTIKNRGNVFVRNNFLEGKADIKKQFPQVLSQNVIAQLLKIEEGLDCECQMNGPFTAKNVCKEAYSKEKAPTKKTATKG